MAPPPLFVTAFKELGRAGWPGFERSANDYLTWFANLARAPLRLICFCEPDIAEKLRAIGFTETYPYDEASTFLSLLPIETAIMNSPRFKQITNYRTDPECTQPAYTLVNHSKYIFMERAHELFPDYTHYAWIDFGYQRTPDVPHTLSFATLTDKIEISSFKSLDPAAILDPFTFCMHSSHIIQGGFFVVPKHRVTWLVAEYKKVIAEYHAQGLVDDDEGLVLQVYKKFPHEYTLHVTSKWFTHLKKFEVPPRQLDIVIVMRDQDLTILPDVIRRARIYIRGVQTIYVIAPSSMATQQIQGAVYINEETFPFTKAQVSQLIGHTYHIGQYQTLLKLYAFKVIPNLHANHLILDSDTLLYNDYEPFDEQGRAKYAVSTEVNTSYRRHMSTLLPGIRYPFERGSGVCHQMLFQTHILQHLFDKSAETTVLRYLPFWKRMLYVAVENGDSILDYSEYDMYFSFVLTFHPDKAVAVN